MKIVEKKFVIENSNVTLTMNNKEMMRVTKAEKNKIVNVKMKKTKAENPDEDKIPATRNLNNNYGHTITLHHYIVFINK